MWLYEQINGKLSRDNAFLAQGYAGHGDGKNDPGKQDIQDVGPLPVGSYVIGAPFDSPRTGPYTLPLTPDLANQMFGRSDFRIHGDSRSDPGSASHGCIILPRFARERVWQSGDHILQVVAKADIPERDQWSAS